MLKQTQVKRVQSGGFNVICTSAFAWVHMLLYDSKRSMTTAKQRLS